VNRHKSAKKKQPVSLSEDMLNELNKNHMGGLDNFGADDLYNMEDVWNEKPMKKVIGFNIFFIWEIFKVDPCCPGSEGNGFGHIICT
jgi:hypothetical protein